MTTATIVCPTPKVGDIMYSSWGYDQTNITFYKIVRVSESSIWLQPVKSKVERQVGWAHYEVTPTDEVAGQITRHKRRETQTHGYWVTVSDYELAYQWDGKPKTESHTC